MRVTLFHETLGCNRLFGVAFATASLMGATPAFADPATGTSTCLQPGGGGSQIVPTQTFKLLPHNTLITLVNPLNPNDTSPLTMLTFGDSAMWGNGLNIDHKYSHQVAQHLADATGRVVNLVTYAHSGANLSTEAGQSYEPLRASDKGTPPGDPNAGLPTMLQQEGCAAQKYAGAEVILLNGCINDVSAEAIGLPFPLSGAMREEIKRRALKQCSDPMRTLLKNTKDDFLKATTIVSNYWLIISDKSSPIGVTMKKGIARSTSSDPALNKEFDDLIAAQIKAEQQTGRNLVETDLASDPAHIFRKWSDNSRAFLDTSQDCFVWAIGVVNGSGPAAKNDNPCLHQDPVQSQLANQDLRVFLATVSDDPAFSFGAGPDKRLWSVPIVKSRYDQEYKRRRAICNTHYPFGGERFICKINPTAHPNVPGANAFADSINTILDVAWRRP
jgi:hypothetical protein